MVSQSWAYVKGYNGIPLSLFGFQMVEEFHLIDQSLYEGTEGIRSFFRSGDHQDLLLGVPKENPDHEG